MADIATLGLSVESSQVKKGAADLDRLTAAATRAEAAAMGVATGSRQAAAGSASVSTNSAEAAVSLDREAAAAKRAAQSLNTHTKVANDNVRRLGGSMSGLAAQGQDVFVTAAAGMNPLIIGLQQGTQIAGQMEMALANGGTAAGVFGTALKSLLYPVSLLSIGLTVLLAAGLQMVDWSAVAAAALNGLAWALENLTPYIIGVAVTLALLYAPAILSGIAAVTVAIGTMSLAALRAAASFTIAWLAALGPAGWFILGLAAVAAAIYVFRDQINEIFGIDIVAAVKDAVNSIIGFFVGAFNAIVAAGGALPAAFGDLSYQIADAFQAGISAMIRSTIASINGLIATINGKLGAIGIEIPTLGGGLTGLNPNGTQSHIKNPYAGAAAGAMGAAQSAFDAAQGVDYVGKIGSAISDMTAGAADKLRGLADGFTGMGDEAGKAGGKAGKALKDLHKDIDKTAEEMAKFDQGLAKGFLSTLRSGLAQGKSLWESFGDAALNVLNKVADKLEDVFVESLFPSSGSGGLFGGGGGFLSTILGGIGAIFGFASGGYTGRGPASQAAGVVHGGEYVFSKKATDRIGLGALDQLHRRAKGYADGGYVRAETPRIYPAGNQNVQRVELVVRGEEGPMFRPTIKAVSNGVAVQVVDQRAPAHAQHAVAQYDKGLPGRIADTMERNG